MVKRNRRLAKGRRPNNGTVVLDFGQQTERSAKQDHKLSIESVVQIIDETIIKIEVSVCLTFPLNLTYKLPITAFLQPSKLLRSSSHSTLRRFSNFTHGSFWWISPINATKLSSAINSLPLIYASSKTDSFQSVRFVYSLSISL